MGFAALGAAALLLDHPAAYVAAGLAIQARLVCNLLDGLMAVEEGQGSPVGALYNDVPDRFADVFLCVGAGYAAGIPELGWAAGVVSVLVAYVRYVGASLTGTHDFRGPMAKPHRMFVLTVACALALIPGVAPWAFLGALGLIVAGGLFTFARRLRTVAQALEAA